MGVARKAGHVECRSRRGLPARFRSLTPGIVLISRWRVRGRDAIPTSRSILTIASLRASICSK